MVCRCNRVLRRKFPCYSGMQVQAFCSRVFRSSCIFKPKTIIQTISTATATNNIPLIAMSTQSSSSNLRRPLFLQCSDCNVPTWSFRGYYHHLARWELTFTSSSAHCTELTSMRLHPTRALPHLSHHSRDPPIHLPQPTLDHQALQLL